MATKKEYSGVLTTNNIKGNGRKKLLIIGKTGTGKSSLCNVITGYDHDADIFPVSAEAVSCTQMTKFAEVFFNNNPSDPISLIDTIGFDDPSKNDDAKIIAELVLKLKENCDHINLFVIAVNGQSPRLDGSLIGMIKIFEGMFSKELWNQVVVVFTRVSMDARIKSKREKTTKKTDDELAEDYMKVVQNQFKEATRLKYIFLDAVYDKEDETEAKAFDKALGVLKTLLDEAPNLTTEKVKEVETENAALKRKIEEGEREKKETERQLKEEMEKLKKDAALSQEEKDRQISQLLREHEANGHDTSGLFGQVGKVIDSVIGSPVKNLGKKLGKLKF